ncbi:hypothetical protein L210DRAFT_937845, partial [Boletus edulis BED1]
MVKEKLISDHAFSPPFHIHGERLLLSVGIHVFAIGSGLCSAVVFPLLIYCWVRSC